MHHATAPCSETCPNPHLHPNPNPHPHPHPHPNPHPHPHPNQKPLLGLYPPLLVIAASYTLGAAAMATTAAALLGGGPLSSWAVSPLEGGVLAFVIAVCAALDYALMTWANARLEVQTAITLLSSK